MGILRIVMVGYGSQLYAGKITEQQKNDFENYCEKNSLDINEVWYKNENDEIYKNNIICGFRIDSVF